MYLGEFFKHHCKCSSYPVTAHSLVMQIHQHLFYCFPTDGRSDCFYFSLFSVFLPLAGSLSLYEYPCLYHLFALSPGRSRLEAGDMQGGLCCMPGLSLEARKGSLGRIHSSSSLLPCLGKGLSAGHGPWPQRSHVQHGSRASQDEGRPPKSPGCSSCPTAC